MCWMGDLHAHKQVNPNFDKENLSAGSSQLLMAGVFAEMMIVDVSAYTNPTSRDNDLSELLEEKKRTIRSKF